MMIKIIFESIKSKSELLKNCVLQEVLKNIRIIMRNILLKMAKFKEICMSYRKIFTNTNNTILFPKLKEILRFGKGIFIIYNWKVLSWRNSLDL